MQTLRGTVKHIALEGGLWILESEDGRKYQLVGGDAQLQVDGRKVVVQGRPGKNQMSIGMAFPIFEVRSYQVSSV